MLNEYHVRTNIQQVSQIKALKCNISVKKNKAKKKVDVFRNLKTQVNKNLREKSKL